MPTQQKDARPPRMHGVVPTPYEIPQEHRRESATKYDQPLFVRIIVGFALLRAGVYLLLALVPWGNPQSAVASYLIARPAIVFSFLPRAFQPTLAVNRPDRPEETVEGAMPNQPQGAFPRQPAVAAADQPIGSMSDRSLGGMPDRPMGATGIPRPASAFAQGLPFVFLFVAIIYLLSAWKLWNLDKFWTEIIRWGIMFQAGATVAKAMIRLSARYVGAAEAPLSDSMRLALSLFIGWNLLIFCCFAFYPRVEEAYDTKA